MRPSPVSSSGCLLGRRTPHVFVVEDLHWADPSTLGLLGLVAAERPGGILT